MHVLVNHFKSQSGDGGEKRRRQAEGVRRIVNSLVAEGEHMIVLGDLNEGQPAEDKPAANLQAPFNNPGPLDCYYDLAEFDVGNRPGTFDSCGIRNRLDYILLSQSLRPAFTFGYLFRKGLWGSRTTRPDQWETYADLTTSVHQAFDHAAAVIHLDPQVGPHQFRRPHVPTY
jgi:hypothetical protein